jgi:hypothetical protein
MKANTLTIIALLTTFAVPAMADTMLGCEVLAVEGSNYVVKADPTCAFDIITGSGASITEVPVED